MPIPRVRVGSIAGLTLLLSCRAGKLFDAPPDNVIGVNPSRVVDSAAASDAAQSRALVISTASRGAAAPWRSYHSIDVTWLTLRDSSGTAPDTLLFTLDPAGLDPGSYQDEIDIVPSEPGVAWVRVPVEFQITTAPPPPPPPSPPGTVNDLAVANVTDSSVTLSFTEVSNGAGQPASYETRWSQGTITWGSATDVSRGSCAVPMAGTSIGTKRSCTVLGLQAGSAYQFQLVAFRGTLNSNAVFGGLSNVASGSTTSLATNLVFTQNPPATLVLGGTFSVQVTARDAQGGTATTFADSVTVTLQGPIVTGGLSGPTTVTAVNGLATFSNLTVSGTCTQCTLVASAAGLTSATSTPFNVVVGP